MPDDNKFIALRRIEYRIPPCCGMCKHGTFKDFRSVWGRCEANSYIHGKHAGILQLGINRYGGCKTGFVADEEAVATMTQSYREFFDVEYPLDELLATASAFQLEPRFQADPACPENECWICTGPLIADDAHIVEHTLRDALEAGLKYIKERPK